MVEARDMERTAEAEQARLKLLRQMNDRERVMDTLRERMESARKNMRWSEERYRAVRDGACYNCVDSPAKGKIDVGHDGGPGRFRDCDVCGGSGKWPN